MSDIDEKVAPRREERLGAGCVYGGNACGLKAQFGGCRLKANQRGFGQGSICQLLPGTAMLSTLPNSVVILHGSLGCGGAINLQTANVRYRQILSGERNPQGAIWMTSNLDERDVVSGGEEKLEKAILAAEQRFRPATIIVVATCVPGIIGDDIDGVAARLQPQIQARILPIHCEGFKTQIMATAYDAIFHSISRHLLPRGEGEGQAPVIVDELEIARERIRRSRLVNLMNFASMSASEQGELTRLLQALGLTVQVFPCYSDPERFVDATQAALSISSCPTHDDYFLKHLQERYGVPYILRHMPIGIAATGDWLRDIARFFHLEKEAEALIAQETRELEEALAPFRAAFAGKKALVSAGEVRAFATAAFLQELGLSIVAVRPYHYDEFGEPSLDRLTEKQDDVIVNVATIQPYETLNIFEKTRPDLYMGHIADNVWAAKAGVPVVPIWHGGFSSAGYSGAFDLARRINRVLRNPSFNRRLRENLKQPYRKEWFHEDPFKYIREAVTN
ncbi:MAG: nitrogenase [Deltaproteobacteria bacterium]|nr:nitrogenase [Deltaproteobacteria bacterium]